MWTSKLAFNWFESRIPLVLLYYCKFTNVRVSFYYKHYCEMVRKKQHYPFASFLKEACVMAFLSCGHLPTVDCDFFYYQKLVVPCLRPLI
jgi:hypothetical protein